MIEDMQKLKNGKIENLIYEVRGQYVLLSRDLSKLYNIETRLINQSVKRNIERFSNECYFQMTDEEFLDWKSQIVISNGEKMGLRKAPYVFTIEGIKILSTILRKPSVQSITLEIEEDFKKLEILNNKSLTIPVSKGERIENLIYEIRGQQVMLDFDLARIYECKNGTKTINLAVKRHSNMFKNDIYFQLSEEEFLNLKFQIETSSWGEHGGIRKLPFAFTEEGVYMLATIIRTEVAEAVTTKIIRAFVAMRKFIGNNLLEQKYINNLVLKHDERLGNVEKLLDSFTINEKNELIFLDGQIYDAYSKIIDIMREAKSELIIVDGYADKKVLDMVSNLSVKVILIVKDKANLKDRGIEEYNKQYSNLSVIRDNSSHDRYFIIDRKTFYHSGASINHAGKGIFSITRMADEAVCEFLLNKIISIISLSQNL